MIRSIEIRTAGRGLIDCTAEVVTIVREANCHEGVVTLFVQHTSASLLIQENADPDVCRDLEAFAQRLAPDGDPLWTHTAEGPDDMPSHVRAALTQTHLAIPISNGAMTLGTWQGIYLWEHRLRGSVRRIVVHVG